VAALVLVVFGFGALGIVLGVVAVGVVLGAGVLVGSLEPLVDVGVAAAVLVLVGMGAVLVGGTMGTAVFVRMRMWVVVEVGTATAALPGRRGPLGVPGWPAMPGLGQPLLSPVTHGGAFACPSSSPSGRSSDLISCSLSARLLVM
jgi:hypothetical protein